MTLCLQIGRWAGHNSSKSYHVVRSYLLYLFDPICTLHLSLNTASDSERLPSSENSQVVHSFLLQELLRISFTEQIDGKALLVQKRQLESKKRHMKTTIQPRQRLILPQDREIKYIKLIQLLIAAIDCMLDCMLDCYSPFGPLGSPSVVPWVPLGPGLQALEMPPRCFGTCGAWSVEAAYCWSWPLGDSKHRPQPKHGLGMSWILCFAMLCIDFTLFQNDLLQYVLNYAAFWWIFDAFCIQLCIQPRISACVCTSRGLAQFHRDEDFQDVVHYESSMGK